MFLLTAGLVETRSAGRMGSCSVGKNNHCGLAMSIVRVENRPQVVLNRRDGGFIQVFQRLLSLEPFEHEKRMDPECPQ